MDFFKHTFLNNNIFNIFWSNFVNSFSIHPHIYIHTWISIYYIRISPTWSPIDRHTWEQEEKRTIIHEFAFASSHCPVWHTTRYRTESRGITIQEGKLYIRSDAVAIYSHPLLLFPTSFSMGLSSRKSLFKQNSKYYTTHTYEPF